MKTILSWILRLGLAGILLMAGGTKLIGDPAAVALFAELGMEPGGRLVIGALEVLAAGLLLVPATVARGALLAFWILLGAFLAHATRIGFAPSSALWGIAFGFSVALLVLHRRGLPFLAKALGDEV